ncbi:putative helicase MOV-10 [Amphiura filiformis]|uniref:putative helicase MOV-10 n=1 Tax=Amphiura filiformis TaxID=82378 RepID=UPI003B22694C
MTRDTPGRARPYRPKHSDCKQTAERFFAYLNGSHHSKVTSKDELRDIFYGDFQDSFKQGEKAACNFSAMIFMLKSVGKIGVQEGHVYLHKGPGFVSVDQYLNLTSKPSGKQQKAAAAKSKTGQGGGNAQYPYYCELCKVQGNSDVSYRGHLTGIRHRYQLVCKAVGARRADLIQAKHGTSLHSEFDTENGNIKAIGEKGKTCSFNITIKNESSSETIAFMSCVVLKDQPAITLSDKYDVTQAKRVVHLKPGFDCGVTVECKLKSVTVLRSPIAFAFKVVGSGEVFQILRFLAVEVGSKVSSDLPPSKPYVRPPRISRREAKGEIVEGKPLPQSQSNQLILENLDNATVPNALRFQLISKGGVGKVKDIIEPPLSWSNYCSKLNTLLHVEECQMEVDIRRYDMKSVVMTQDGNPRFLRLKVPGLAENRPSVLKGDYLYAHFADSPQEKCFKGYVHRIELEEVILGFGGELMARWTKGMRFDIEFTFNRVPIKLQHRAVRECSVNKMEMVLFPKKEKVGSLGLLCTLPADESDFGRELFDRQLASNAEQVKAVRQIVQGTSRPAPYLVFGPPGTGKTVTVVEAIKQVYSKLRASYILACAPSNSAADLLAKRLITGGTPVAKTTILRMNAASRVWPTVDQELKGANCCNFNKMTGENYFPSKEDIMRKRIVVTTLVTAGRIASAKDFPRDHFTHIFLDEAGHAVEPEAIISIGSLLNPRNKKGGQIVLAGDPKQLGPVLRSPLAKEHGLELSLLERLMTQNPLYTRKESDESKEIYDSRILTKLIRNYRSHPAILKLPNQMFYDNELQVHANEMVRNTFTSWDHLPRKGFPIIFHGVEGRDEREGQSPSFFNLQEVQVVVEYIEDLREKRGGRKIKQSDIGIISPYRRQVQKIQQVLKRRNHTEIKVGSVEEFQGQERLIIIVSTVRSTKPEHLQLDMDYKLGFLRNPKRFNVAITRAKALLVVIGNPYMLSKDEHWNQLLHYCRENEAYTGCHYADDDNTLDDIIHRLEKINLGDMAEEPKEEPTPDEPSLVSQHNDPEWRGEN